LTEVGTAMIKRNLSSYDFPGDLKKMDMKELKLLSYQIREFLIDTLSDTGGHLASNLGVVELTLALHYVFESPHDKIVWDVGHQTYVHKILTGRASRFNTLRKYGGLSGFPKNKESEHDIFDTGHGSASLSFAAGLAAAKDLKGGSENVIAVIGDGAFTGGLSFEALNNLGYSKKKMMIILNDNGMSISPNIGGLSKHLVKLRSSKKYLNIKKNIKKKITGIPAVGYNIYKYLSHMRDAVKYSIIDEGVIFEEMGIKYLGPVDGHDINQITDTLVKAKQINAPVIIHTITKKGKGFVPAEKHPEKFHGTGPFDKETGAQVSTDAADYSDVLANAVIENAKRNDRIVAIGAAMLESTGLIEFKNIFPERTFDVGLAEEHAATFAAGLARNGYIPVVAIYSTFLQRAYDEIMEDVCLQNLPVIFAIDRAGIVGADGETHHGIFDLSYLSHMPGMTVMAPSCDAELEAIFNYAVGSGTPCAIRYPRGTAAKRNSEASIITGKSERVISGKDAEIWSIGRMLDTAVEISEKAKAAGIDIGVVNARFAKPLDEAALYASADRTRLIITIEDNVLTAGFGQSVLAALNKYGSRTPVMMFGWPDKFIEHGTCEELEKAYGLDAETLTERICRYFEGKA